MKIASLFLALVAGTISSVQPALAGSDLSERQVLELVKQGRILKLDTILERYATHGRLLDLEVERDDGTIIYELELLRDDGYVVEMKIDAVNGELIEQEVER